MDLDGSFAEYVSARWSMHYRLAVLLAGPDGADALTQAALVRAYASWRDVRGASSSDAAVSKILVRTAVALAKRDRVGEESTDSPEAPDENRDELWPRIAALPPRERAVVVLLCYEDLSEAEAARALGCRTGTVQADAFAAFGTHGLADFTMHDVRDELVRRADEAEVPLPPIPQLVGRGRQQRRRRVRRSLTWSAAVAAVLVIGTTLGSVVGTDEPDRTGTAGPTPPSAPALPSSLNRLHDGDPADVVYSSARTLHVDGRVVGLDGRPSAIAETPSTVYVAYPTGTIVQVVRATLEVERLTDSAAGPMVTDPARDQVAWPVVENGQAKVVVHPIGADVLTTGKEQIFPARPRCCDNPFVVAGITEDGEVVGSLPAASRAWVWDTRDGALREIEGIGNGLVDEVTATELVVHHPPFHYAVGKVEGSAFLATGELTARTADFGDPLGRRVVYVDQAGETHVRDRGRSPRGNRRPRNDVRLELPLLDAGFAGVRWTDTHHVLLDVSDDVMPYGALVRCNVYSGACEISIRFDGPHLVAH